MNSVAARAKLNLYLHITGRRADGYHLLESLIVFAELADQLKVEAADTLTLEVKGEFAEEAGTREENLVLRAAELLQRVTGVTYGAKLTLQKHIPVGGGLGGGSADAAATLKLLNQFWALNLSDKELLALAPKLGADVAMCLASHPLIARGIGEELQPLDHPLPQLTAVLVHPRQKLLTPHVYAMLTEDWKHRGHAGAVPEQGLISWLKTNTRNDLQRPAIAVTPLVSEVLLAMETTSPMPEFIRMTGSGACCFALFGDADRAATYAAALRHKHPDWWVRVSAISR